MNASATVGPAATASSLTHTAPPTSLSSTTPFPIGTSPWTGKFPFVLSYFHNTSTQTDPLVSNAVYSQLLFTKAPPHLKLLAGTLPDVPASLVSLRIPLVVVELLSKIRADTVDGLSSPLEYRRRMLLLVFYIIKLVEAASSSQGMVQDKLPAAMQLTGLITPALAQYLWQHYLQEVPGDGNRNRHLSGDKRTMLFFDLCVFLHQAMGACETPSYMHYLLELLTHDLNVPVGAKPCVGALMTLVFRVPFPIPHPGDIRTYSPIVPNFDSTRFGDVKVTQLPSASDVAARLLAISAASQVVAAAPRSSISAADSSMLQQEAPTGATSHQKRKADENGDNREGGKALKPGPHIPDQDPRPHPNPSGHQAQEFEREERVWVFWQPKWIAGKGPAALDAPGFYSAKIVRRQSESNWLTIQWSQDEGTTKHTKNYDTACIFKLTDVLDTTFPQFDASK